MSFHSLNDSTTANPINQTIKPKPQAAGARFIIEFSVIHAIAGSTNEIEDVQAANATKTKNKVPIKPPPGIWPKAMGSVWKIKPGPALGSKWFANTKE